MSGQDVGFFDVGTDCPDMVIENGDLKEDNGLETSALISLFSDRRVSIEEIPDGEDNPHGWWADLISEPSGDRIGSRFWAIERIGKVLASTTVDVENALSECFEWMLEDGIASKVVVDAQRNGRNEIRGSAQIFKPDGDIIPFKFIWDGQRFKLTEQ